MRALLTILASVAAAAAVWFWFARDTATGLPAPVAPRRAEVAAADVPPERAADAAHWERVHRQLERIAERLTALEQRFAAAPVAEPMRTSAAAPAVIDSENLVRALEEVEARRAHDRYAAMGDAELLAEVGRLQWKGGDVTEAERALRHLLARDLDPDARADARTQLGMLQRQRKDLDGSAHTLQAVVDERGMQDKRGGWAAYQLAWTLGERDPSAALVVADRLGQQAGDAGTRTRARWSAARFAEQLGDVARARADYQALLVECGEDERLADVAKDLRWRLRELDRR